MPTRREARRDAARRLRDAGDPTSLLDADLLLAHVLGVAREALYAHDHEPLGGSERETFEALLERRAGGEPVAYLRGHKEFYGLRFAVDPRVLIPRPETETLVDAALGHVRRTGARTAVDVGTGSGAVAIALAVHEPDLRVVAVDVSPDALEVARANAATHGVAGRVDFRRSDLLESVTERVELVVANLPYLPERSVDEWVGERTSLRFEPRAAVLAGTDGLDLIRRCVPQVPRVLAPGGAAFFECDPPQVAEVAALIERALGGPARIHRDLAGAERVVEAARPRDPAGDARLSSAR
ncbi:MAG: peptide chain release factor N(5)-glutamine methyltransferase [Candidatus Limnocylindria bacterium]